MSQHDMDLANAAGATFRSDLNAALVALATQQSGAAAPSTTYAYQLWADTTANLLKRRNAANSGWIVLGTLSETFVLSRSSNTILAGSDMEKTIVATAAFTQTLTAAATLGDGWFVGYNAQGFSIVLDPNGAETIDGAATKTVTGSGFIYCNGSAFFTIGFPAAGASGAGFVPLTASIGSNALTASLVAGTVLNFNDGTSVTLGSTITVTASSGSTLGTSSGVASRIWVVALKNSGTPELALRNNVSSATNDHSIEWPGMDALISTTAEGGAGAADSAQTFYSTTSRSSQPWAVVGYIDSTQATAGTWATALTKTQGFGPGVALPGSTIQRPMFQTGLYATGSTAMPSDATVPQITEGDQYMSKAITPTSASNKLRINVTFNGTEDTNTSTNLSCALFQDSTANALAAVTGSAQDGSLAIQMHPLTFSHTMTAGTASSTTFRVRAGLDTASPLGFNGISGGAYFGAKMPSSLHIEEIQT